MAALPQPDIFNDRPGTRIRIVLPVAEAKTAGKISRFFGWVFKLIYAFVAGVLCAALASYMPVGGPAWAQFAPENCAAFVHISNGAALHRSLLECDALNQLLDDNDSGSFVLNAMSKPSIADDVAEEKTDSKVGVAENAATTLRAQIDAAFAHLDQVPWYARWLAPKRAAEFYPILGGECAAAYCPSLSGIKSSAPQILLFARVSGSRGWLLRVATPFLKSKKIELFDLGGGLIAAGLNGARPAFGAHPSSIIFDEAGGNSTPLLQIACTARALNVQRATDDTTREALNKQIDAGDTVLSRLSEEGVPDPFLYSLLKPPTVGDMFNWPAPPEISRINVFARKPENGGGVEIVGALHGAVPPLASTEATNSPAEFAGIKPIAEFSKMSPADAVAEMVLPIDLRALFIRHVVGTMKLSKNAEGLTRGQRRWIARFRALETDGAEPDRDLWPSVGHVAKISIHEAHSDVTGSNLGAAKAWMSFKPARPDDALFSAADLIRLYWGFLFVNGQKATVNPRYVRRFTPRLPPGELFNEKPGPDVIEDRYVLATGLTNAPAWSIGPNGFRITSEAGADALLKGPDPKSFLPPPEKLDAYRIRIDGARLAPTAEALTMVLYDDIEEEFGNAQKFHAQYPDSALNIRLARKWTSLLGNFELELKPGAGGASLRALWIAGRMPASAGPQREKSNNDSVPPPPAPGENPKSESKKPDSKKKDDDDAPPPPPPPGN